MNKRTILAGKVAGNMDKRTAQNMDKRTKVAGNMDKWTVSKHEQADWCCREHLFPRGPFYRLKVDLETPDPAVLAVMHMSSQDNHSPQHHCLCSVCKASWVKTL